MNSRADHRYEGMYIFRPTLSDDAREKALKKVIASIENLGGSHEKTIDWGRKKMAYDIKGSREGFYSLVYFSLPTENMDEVIRDLHLNEDILRFVHMRIEEYPQGNEITFKPLVQIER